MHERWGALERPPVSGVPGGHVARKDPFPGDICTLCDRSVLTGQVGSSSTPRLPAARGGSMNSNMLKTFCVNLNMIFTSLVESVMATGPGPPEGQYGKKAGNPVASNDLTL